MVRILPVSAAIARISARVGTGSSFVASSGRAPFSASNNRAALRQIPQSGADVADHTGRRVRAEAHLADDRFDDLSRG
jgi:hypothetical protein